jgi:hypothetical protein
MAFAEYHLFKIFTKIFFLYEKPCIFAPLYKKAGSEKEKHYSLVAQLVRAADC